MGNRKHGAEREAEECFTAAHKVTRVNKGNQYRFEKSPILNISFISDDVAVLSGHISLLLDIKRQNPPR